MCFIQYQVALAVLGWLGNEEDYVMHAMQLGWCYRYGW